MKHETSERDLAVRQETRDRRQKTGDKRQETRDRSRETGCVR